MGGEIGDIAKGGVEARSTIGKYKGGVKGTMSRYRGGLGAMSRYRGGLGEFTSTRESRQVLRP